MTTIGLGTVGTNVVFTFVNLYGEVVDISGATVTVMVTDPSGAVQTLSGSVISGPAGTASVLTPATVFNAVGQWSFRARAYLDDTHNYPDLVYAVQVK